MYEVGEEKRLRRLEANFNIKRSIKIDAKLETSQRNI
jgi:hypothetical protein